MCSRLYVVGLICEQTAMWQLSKILKILPMKKDYESSAFDSNGKWCKFAVNGPSVNVTISVPNLPGCSETGSGRSDISPLYNKYYIILFLIFI